jgi:hypothetical protein
MNSNTHCKSFVLFFFMDIVFQLLEKTIPRVKTG